MKISFEHSGLPAVISLLVDLGIFFSEVSDLVDFLSRVL